MEDEEIDVEDAGTPFPLTKPNSRFNSSGLPKNQPII